MSGICRCSRAALALGASALLAGVAVAAEKEVQLSEVPAAVRATIDERLKGAAISEIELEEEDGRQIYSVEFVRDGREVEIEVAANGDFLGEEVEDDDDEGRDDDDDTTGTASDDDDSDDDDDAADGDDEEKPIAIDEAPEAVKAALKPLVGGATIKAMTMESENGKVVYEAEFVSGGVTKEVEVSEDGTLLETEEEVKADALPAAVKNAVKAKYPEGAIKEAAKVTEKNAAGDKQYFEVEVKADGKTRELKVDESGKVHGTDDDD